MPHYLDISHVLVRRRPPRERRSSSQRSGELAGPTGQVPSGLQDPIALLSEPGRTIYEFSRPRVTLTNGGGRVVTNARLVLLFWGEFWQAASPSVTEISTAVGDIIQSPYLSELTQYGFANLTLGPVDIVLSPGPSFPTFSTDNVRDMVWDLIDAGRYPEPGEDGGDIVYMVFMPAGTQYEDPKDDAAHTVATDYDFPGGTDIAWVGFVNYPKVPSLDEILAPFSHELVETISDPEPTSGWTAAGIAAPQNEIGDICNQNGMVAGHKVRAYYSQRLRACVVPSYPMRRILTLNESEERLGESWFENEGRTKNTNLSSCFSGTYDWRQFSRGERVTLTVDVSDYIQPKIAWTVSGQSVSDTTTVVSIESDPWLDPLSQIVNVPAVQVAIRAVVYGATSLVMEIAAGDPGVHVHVACSVEDSALPEGYQTKREAEYTAIMAGSFRVMGSAFQVDLQRCILARIKVSEGVLREKVIPRIDKGDPAPVWVVRESIGVGAHAENQKDVALFLAHAIEKEDPQVAAGLRALASGRAAVARAAESLEKVEQSPSEVTTAGGAG
jgi:hypothetical protein